VLLALVPHQPPARPPPFLVLQQFGPAPVSFRDRVERRLPTSPKWAWLWSLESKLFGKRAPINLNADIFALYDPSPATLVTFALGDPNFSDPAGLRVWLVDAEQFETLQKHLNAFPGAEPLSHARISTADGIGCGLSQGQTIQLAGAPRHVGLRMNCLAHLYRDRTDLIAGITLSELVTNLPPTDGDTSPTPALSIRTNLDASFRLQIAKGKGVFLLSAAPAQSNRKNIVVLLAPPQAKRSMAQQN